MAILVFMLYTSDALWHWFVLPVFACGIVIGTDAIAWIRERMDFLDPIGLVGLLGFHFFFLAPLLHPYLDWWMPYVSPPAEWRDWLGRMALINLAGLLLYRFVRHRAWRLFSTTGTYSRWTLNTTRFVAFLLVGMVVSLALQIQVYREFGGIVGYANSFSYDAKAFEGKGFTFIVSEQFPILLIMAYAIYAQKRPWARSGPAAIGVLGMFLVLQFVFGGLRGSRANTIWALFWAAGVFHLYVRPLKKQFILAGVAFLLIFMYVYGFYKEAGVEAVPILADTQAQVQFGQQTQRNFTSLILGDLGRSDVQALVLERLVTYSQDINLAWGRTYLGSLALLIPRSVWPDRIPTKVKEGTEALYGESSYLPDDFAASNVYGIAGEAMLNWGPPAALLAFVVLGVLVVWTKTLLTRWQEGDSRLMLLPMILTWCFFVLIYDSDNVLFLVLKTFAIPFFLIWLASNSRMISSGDDHYGTKASCVPMPHS